MLIVNLSPKKPSLLSMCLMIKDELIHSVPNSFFGLSGHCQSAFNYVSKANTGGVILILCAPSASLYVTEAIHWNIAIVPVYIFYISYCVRTNNKGEIRQILIAAKLGHSASPLVGT